MKKLLDFFCSLFVKKAKKEENPHGERFKFVPNDRHPDKFGYYNNSN